ncbi:hypothetical protein GQ53DRAFT_758916 [Thozetella sp. PMI_491]|nr:hypothetical protein GQ53DRAFT_758916 [Thozetella sp. PMI_491]
MAAQILSNMSSEFQNGWPSALLRRLDSSLAPEIRNVVLLGIICFVAATWLTKYAVTQNGGKSRLPDTKQFDCMGTIEGLDKLKWEEEKPERIYKFADTYHLTMGLRKTDINWITRVDQQYRERIEERKKIIEQYPGALGYVESGVEMLNELYSFMFTHYLPKRYPTMFRIDAKRQTCHNLVLDKYVPLSPPTDHIEALRHIALAIDEDFLMLLPSPDGDGYSLQAFVWLYPVGFDPQAKLGMKLRDAHKPVPSYKQHLQMSMDRYFARLTPGNVVNRVNWAVATNSSLCERGEYHLYSDEQVPTDTKVDMNDTWVRCELQTLFGLPKSGGRILSVHLYLYPIQEIKDVGLAEEMCRAIDGYGAGNAPGFSRYKRIPVWGEVVKKFLRS